MHMAKDSGRRNLQFYAPAQDGQATQAQMLMQEQQLRGALERGRPPGRTGRWCCPASPPF